MFCVILFTNGRDVVVPSGKNRVLPVYFKRGKNRAIAPLLVAPVIIGIRVRVTLGAL